MTFKLVLATQLFHQVKHQKPNPCEFIPWYEYASIGRYFTNNIQMGNMLQLIIIKDFVNVVYFLYLDNDGKDHRSTFSLSIDVMTDLVFKLSFDHIPLIHTGTR